MHLSRSHQSPTSTMHRKNAHPSIQQTTPSLSTFFRQFYILNAESLLSSLKRPEACSIFLLFLEHMYLFSLLLTATYISIDSTGELFSYISLHSLSEPFINATILFILSINILIISLLLFFVFLFIIKPYSSKQSQILSASIMNYNNIILTPAVILTMKVIFSASSSTDTTSTTSVSLTSNLGKGILIANLILTITLSAINSAHSIKSSYSFYAWHSDSLQKFGSMWDVIKYQILAGSIVLIETFEKQQAYAYLVCALSAGNLCDFLLRNVYYSRKVSTVYVSLQLNLIGFSCVAEFQARCLNNNNTQVTAIVILLCSIFPMACVASLNIIDAFYRSILTRIHSCLEIITNTASNSNARSAATATTNIPVKDREFYLDFFTRNLISNVQFTQKNSNLMRSFFEQVTTFPDPSKQPLGSSNYTRSSVDQQQPSFAILIEESEIQAISSLRMQVKLLLEYFRSTSSNNSDIMVFAAAAAASNQNVAPGSFSTTISQSNGINQMWELFYLLEIEGNLPKLAISIQNYLYNVTHSNRTQLSLRECARISYLQAQVDAIEQMNNYYSNHSNVAVVSAAADPATSNSSSIYNKNNDKYSKPRIDFAHSFRFQEDLTHIEEGIVQALRMKLDFLNAISMELMDLSNVARVGSELMQAIKSISQGLFRMNQSIKSTKAPRNSNLDSLSKIFVECLWVDPYDIKLKLNSKVNKINSSAIQNNLSQSTIIRKGNAVSQQLLQVTIAQQQQQQLRDQQMRNEKQQYKKATTQYESPTTYLSSSNNYIRDDDCIVLVSLSEKRFGRITKVSANCLSITGYSANELINSNCGIIMPTAIAIHHSTMIRSGIEAGVHVRRFSHRQSPMILKHKNGFAVRVHVDLQMHCSSLQNENHIQDYITPANNKRTNGSMLMSTADKMINEIGFAARIRVDSKSEKITETTMAIKANQTMNQSMFSRKYSKGSSFMLVDVSSSRTRAEVMSKSLFDRLFSSYFGSVQEINGKELCSIIPLLTKLKEHLLEMQNKEGDINQENNVNVQHNEEDDWEEEDGTNEFLKFETLLFLPTGPSSEHIKRRLSDNQSSSSLVNCARKQYLSQSRNDIFQAKCSARLYTRRDEEYSLILLRIEEFKVLWDDSELEKYVQSVYLPQLLKFNALPSDAVEMVAKRILNRTNEFSEFGGTVYPCDKKKNTQFMKVKDINRSSKQNRLLSENDNEEGDDNVVDTNKGYDRNSNFDVSSSNFDKLAMSLVQIDASKQEQQQIMQQIQQYQQQHNFQKQSSHQYQLASLPNSEMGFASLVTLNSPSRMTKSTDIAENQTEAQVINKQTSRSASSNGIDENSNTNNINQIPTNTVPRIHVTTLGGHSNTEELKSSSNINLKVLKTSISLQPTSYAQQQQQQHETTVWMPTNCLSPATTDRQLLITESRHFVDSPRSQKSNSSTNNNKNNKLNKYRVPMKSIHQTTTTTTTTPSGKMKNSNTFITNENRVSHHKRSSRILEMNSSKNQDEQNNHIQNMNSQSKDQKNKQDFLHFDSASNNNIENNNNNNNTFDFNAKKFPSKEKQSHRNSISSHRSSQKSTSLREMLFRGISDESTSHLLQLKLIGFITVCFLFIICIACTIYLSIRSQLTLQELSFSFSWWQDKVQDSTFSILRLSEAYSLIQFTRMGGNSSEITTFKNSISNTTGTLYSNCLSSFSALYEHDFDELYLVELLHTTPMNYMRYIDQNNYYNQTYSMLQVFELYAYSAYQFARKQFNLKLLVELEIVSNLNAVASTIDVISTALTQSEKELVATMKSLVSTALYAILSISFVIAATVFPFYAYYQAKKQFVLRLFASIAQENLLDMYAESSNGILQIQLDRNTKNHTSISSNKNKNNINPTKNPIAKTNRMSNSSSINSNAISAVAASISSTVDDLKRQQVIKTRKNVPTTYLSKLNLRFIVQVMSILCVINVQPIVNSILISAQVSESETELAVVKSLYELSTAFVYSEYAIFATTEKTAAPFTTLLDLSVFQEKVYASIDGVDSAIHTLSSAIQSLSTQSNYETTELGAFISEMFTVDACNALANAKEAYFENNGGLTYNSTLCTSLYDGILTKGYFQAVNTFYQVLSSYAEITENDTLTSRQKTTLFTEFYTNNTPLMMENLFTMLKIASSAVINAISEEKEQYYSTLEITQLALFIFEVAFLLVLFPTIVVPFFTNMKCEFIHIVELIQVLQIHQIQENSYVCNFIKKSQSS